ncbi:hypothetical protein Tcan_10564 [Toxocara canis]|uniref:Uncharacterized protein n=2 Tax=Toxocara canis TaxID=6265 RepID=A0A0B2UXE9_TOXCA|nr:hypothetical protein Tcan_10564 [Toxocara canis]VDM40523.1 unnamed protein product [Toxocara canis]
MVINFMCSDDLVMILYLMAQDSYRQDWATRRQTLCPHGGEGHQERRIRIINLVQIWLIDLVRIRLINLVQIWIINLVQIWIINLVHSDLVNQPGSDTVN